MPANDSNLTNTYIANTYQKLLQIDSQYGSIGTTAPFVVSDAVTSSKHNLLNGLGQNVPGVVIDTSGNGNGGLMFKDGNSDPNGLWSIQSFKTSNNEGGLNFWRPNAGGNPNSNNAKLFLKNTGTIWVGYQNGSNPVIPVDVTNYSLYVKNGIQIGQNTTDNNGRINLIGGSPLENGSGFFINGEHPFKLLRVRYKWLDLRSEKNPELRDENNQPVSTSEWSAMIVGTYWDNDRSSGDVNDDDIVLDYRFRCLESSGIWILNLMTEIDDDNNNWTTIPDILLIKKGFADDHRDSLINLPGSL